jgi:leucyl-tRNA synthetase
VSTVDKPTRIYDFKAVEDKWQQEWQAQNLYAALELPDPDNRFYMLEMFAYPSGDIHMGHFRNYIIGDAVARYQMMLGKGVLHPFGWDAFGLPAERAAIERKIHPSEWTQKNITTSRSTLQKAGISYDWSREINSSDPEYYRWTQWIFIQLFKKGLAYRKRGYVNWCPTDKTVLANEQVKDGKCERCDTVVEKKDQIQWYFKITDYADQLTDDLDKLPDWPDSVKTMQREWIGRSYGTEIDFTIEDSGEKLPVYTTRPDTIFGVTFMAIAPEAELIVRLNLAPEFAEKVCEYREIAMRRSEIDRAAATGEKDGVFTGKYAINPYNGERVQLWVADYVLAGYGTGTVMAVPAHDTRDFAFAKKYDIPIKIVIHPDADTPLEPGNMDDAFTGYGVMVNSGRFDGLVGQDAIKKVTDFAEKEGFGRYKTNFKLKDWSISRQRYWGCPIPIIHCDKCGEAPVPDDQLPVELPVVENFLPKGRSPLADVPDYMNVTCPECGGEAQRDPDTMDTYVCSSWYQIRYVDAHNDQAPFDKDKAARWLPVDLYVGGITHATGHLIYFRFFHKFLRDLGWVKGDEPVKRLVCLGMVADEKGETMSKSKGNAVPPFPYFEKYGIDVTRLAMFFTGPTERGVLWDGSTFLGVQKFLNKALVPLVDQFRKCDHDLKQHFNVGDLSKDERAIYVKLNQTIKRVGEDIDRLQLNTAIAALMELVRDYQPDKIANDQLNDSVVLKTIQLVAPLAPHLAEELWHQAGFEDSVFKSLWPVFDPKAIVGESIEIAVQINGRLRDTVTVAADADQAAVEAAAFESSKIQNHTDGKQIVKKIFVKGRILNIVVK